MESENDGEKVSGVQRTRARGERAWRRRRVSVASRRRRVGIELRLLHIMTVKMTERKLLK